MTPVIVSKVLTAGVANNIAQAQTLGAAGAITLNGAAVSGGVATLDTQRRVVITSAGNDTAVVFTVTGTNDSGGVIVDRFNGASGAAATSNLDFKTVTSITASAATSSITIGTGATGSTQWFMPNFHMAPFYMEVDCFLTGAATYSVEITHDDYWTPRTPMPVPNWRRVIDSATTSASINMLTPCRGWRMTITAGTGTVTCEATQAGISNV